MQVNFVIPSISNRNKINNKLNSNSKNICQIPVSTTNSSYSYNNILSFRGSHRKQVVELAQEILPEAAIEKFQSKVFNIPILNVPQIIQLLNKKGIPLTEQLKAIKSAEEALKILEDEVGVGQMERDIFKNLNNHNKRAYGDEIWGKAISETFGKPTFELQDVSPKRIRPVFSLFNPPDCPHGYLYFVTDSEMLNALEINSSLSKVCSEYDRGNGVSKKIFYDDVTASFPSLWDSGLRNVHEHIGNYFENPLRSMIEVYINDAPMYKQLTANADKIKTELEAAELKMLNKQAAEQLAKLSNKSYIKINTVEQG